MKRIYRSTTDKKIAGVCAGLGEYFDVDPVIFRLGFLFAFFLGGTGVLVYIIAWIAIPIKHI